MGEVFEQWRRQDHCCGQPEKTAKIEMFVPSPVVPTVNISRKNGCDYCDSADLEHEFDWLRLGFRLVCARQQSGGIDCISLNLNSLNNSSSVATPMNEKLNERSLDHADNFQIPGK